MDLYLYVILTIFCVSPIFTSECPDSCECKMFSVITITRETQVCLKVNCVNGLRGVPRDHIGSDVTYLDLSSNQIKTLANVDEKAKNMTEIKQLILEKSQITKIEVNSLRGFNWLENLDISINNISDLPSDLFKNMHKLETLHLSYNPFLILPENGFDTKKLRRLFIGSCNLKDIPPKFFDKMPELKYLHLENNQITHLGDHLITQFREMTFINLEHNNLTVFQPKLVDLFIETYTLIGLNYNPFICDCQLRLHYEMYKAHYVIGDSDDWLNDSEHELQCEIPTENNKTLKSIEDQDDYFRSLGCNISMSEETPDYFSTYEYYKWYMHHTVQWTFLGLVAVTGLCVGIIVMVMRRRHGVEFSNQIILPLSELEAREEDYV